MPTITIDDRSVQVEDGQTILDAAEKLNIAIPTLCFLKGYEPSTSCQVCMVKNRVTRQLVPACATKVENGMEIASESEEVHNVRRTALELLLSDHVGDCFAPCFFACPAHMDIPLMLRQISDQELRNAIATVKKDIALPAVLGRVCPKPCEKGCRRNAADDPVAVCELKRHVADTDLATDAPYEPPCQPDTGKRVAIVGAGPTGLSAAFYLRQQGHGCFIFDDQPQAGGRLRREFSQDELPRDVLDAEILQVTRLGVTIKSVRALDQAPSLDDLCRDYDAVLVACGAVEPDQVKRWGLTPSRRGIDVHRETFQTRREGVFAAGNAIRGKGLVVRSVADGKEVAQTIGQLLAGQAVAGPGKPFSSRMGSVKTDELPLLLGDHAVPRCETPCPGTDFSPSEASQQSQRCMVCGCPAHGKCKLERYAIQYGADSTRFAALRRSYEIVGRESSVVFEPGKCIKCELCVQIAAQAKEPLGLTFVDRGFDVRLRVPFNGTMDDALSKVAAQCVAACPTGAIWFAKDRVAPG